MTTDLTKTEHQKNWWGIQECRRCNPQALQGKRPVNLRPACPDCNGSGWTEWAALATQPWTEIIPGLWVGGHDFNANVGVGHKVITAKPDSRFDFVVSAYHRPGFEPSPDVEHHQVLFPDSRLTVEVQRYAVSAARLVAERVGGGATVLARCQAGLNRSSLIAGTAMVMLGFSGEDAVQLIRARRSPWALCNEDYADFISGLTRHDIESLTAEGVTLG